MCNGLQKAKISEHQATYGDALLAEFLCYQASRIQGASGQRRPPWMPGRQAGGSSQQIAQQRRLTLAGHRGRRRGKADTAGDVASHAWGVYLIRTLYATSAKNKKENSWRSPLELRPGF